MGMVHKRGASEVSPPDPSRRRIIQRGAVAAGAAWVAPTILSMSTAGALTTTCYGFKLDSACTCTGQTSDGVACDGSFAAAVTANGAIGACPPAGVITALSGCGDDGSITVRSGCSIAFLQIKPGGPDQPDCVTFCDGCGSQTVSWTNPVRFGISHINVIVCCVS
jgi:hypothetical protein